MNFLEKLLGEASVEWKNLGDVCTIKTGPNINKKIIDENPGNYPVINSGRDPLGYVNTFNTDNDPIGIASRGSVGIVSWTPGKYFRGNLNYSCTVKDEKLLNVRFLYHFLLHADSDIQALATHQGIPALNAGALKTLKVPIVNIEIQAEIVRILDAMTAHTAELTTELTARKKQYNYYRNKLLSFEGAEVEWQTLGEVATVTKLAGFEFTNHVRYSDSGTIIALRGLNVKGNLDLSDVKYIDESNFSKLSRSKLYVDDMLFTYVGTVGSVALIDENDKYYLAPNVALIRLETKKIIPRYMFHYFQTSDFRKTQIDRFSGNSSMQNLTMENIRKFKIAVPSVEEQFRIVEILDKFDGRIQM